MIRHESALSAPTAQAEDLDEATPAALPLCNGSNGCYPPRRRRRLSASPFTRYAAWHALFTLSHINFKPHLSFVTLMTRISNYEKESVRYLHDLRMKPKSLVYLSDLSPSKYY